MAGAHTCFPLVNHKFAIGQRHKHLVIQIPEKKEVANAVPGAEVGVLGQGALVSRVYLFLFFTLKVCGGEGTCGREAAVMFPH